MLADSQGRKCGEILSNLFNKNYYETLCLVKPNACIEQLCEHIKNLTSDFTKQDYVILLGGTNNALSNKYITSTFLDSFRELLSHTNCIIILTPFWNRHTHFNSIVLQNNLLLYNNLHQSCKIIDPQSCLSSQILPWSSYILFREDEYNDIHCTTHNHSLHQIFPGNK